MCMTVSACHLNVTESIARLKDTDTKSTPMHFTATANQVSRSSLVGRSRRAVCLCCRHRRATFADARSACVLTACHSEVSVTERRPVKFPSSGNS